MPLAVILSLCAAGVAAGTPATLYLFWLSHLHRRGAASAVAGRGDFLALLAGLFGFLLVGFLVAIVTVGTWWQAGGKIWDGSAFEAMRDTLGTSGWAWSGTAVGLLLVFAGLMYRGMNRRRSQLAVYNATEADADVVLAAAFDGLKLNAVRTGRVWGDGRPLLEVAPFHAVRHLTLTALVPDPRLAEEILRAARNGFEGRPAGENPAAPWMLTAAVCGFVSVLCFVGLILVGVLSR